MPASTLHRHARSVLTLNPSPPRLQVGLKAATAMGLPLVLAQALDRLPLGLLCSLGVFAILYGPTTPGRFRARLVGLAGAGLVTSTAVGALTAGHPVLTVVALGAAAVVSTLLCVTLKVGPPGAYFLVLVLGVANTTVAHGVAAETALLATVAGAVVAWGVSMVDLLWAPHRAESRAVAAADLAVGAFERSGGDDLDPARAAASRALHQAWTAVRDGGEPSPQREDVQRVQDRYAAATAALAHRRLTAGADGEADPFLRDPEPWGSVDDEAAEQDADRPRQVDPEVDVEQLRDSSLGRPGAAYLLREGMRWPSEALLVAARVGLATALAGTIALLSGQGHGYWTVAFAMLVLHQGGTREAQTVRGIHRALGTLGGILLFAASLLVGLHGWGVVAAVVLLQLVVELLVTRNYALAVVFITPLALTIATASVPPSGVDAVISDRVVDTLVGVGSALVVLWVTGRRTPERQLRAHGRRVVVAVERVLVDLAAGSLEGRDALDHRRALYYELLESDAVARRATADAPAQVRPYRQMERSLSRLGYLVLGACWHPELRAARDTYALARGRLERILAEPVGRPRPAETIERDVRAVEEIIAAIR